MGGYRKVHETHLDNTSPHQIDNMPSPGPPSRLKRAFKRLAHALFGRYEHYYLIYRDLGAGAPPPIECPSGVAVGGDAALACCTDSEVCAFASIVKPGARAAVLSVEGHAAAAAWVWYGDLYRQLRGYWPLATNEGEVMHVVVARDQRGRGLGKAVTRLITREAAGLGLRRLYGRVWVNNTPSLRSFAGAGWSVAGRVIGIRPFGLPLLIRVFLPRRRVCAAADPQSSLFSARWGRLQVFAGKRARPL